MRKSRKVEKREEKTHVKIQNEPRAELSIFPLRRNVCATSTEDNRPTIEAFFLVHHLIIFY